MGNERSDVRTIIFDVGGKEYSAELKSRPFREGIEVVLDLDGELIRIPELGFGDTAIVERLKGIVRERLAKDSIN